VIQTLSIARDFSKTPGSRRKTEGEFSGELFRESILAPIVGDALANGDTLLINFDGTAGYGTSFIEESFGGLIRKHNFDYEKLAKCLEFVSAEDPDVADDARRFMLDAAEARARIGR
jgi:hypothetical protein